MVPFPPSERIDRSCHARRQAAAVVATAALVALLSACGGGQDELQAPAAGTPGPAITAAESGGDRPGAPGSPALNEPDGPDGSGISAGSGSGGDAGSGAPNSTATVLDALNAARATPRDCGATRYPAVLPLAIDSDAEAAARSHTSWMQANRTMSHTGAGGSSVGTRLSDTGYRWSAVGENVAMGQASPASVVAAWLASPGHCANIMNSAFVDAGFSFAPSAGAAATYATLVLARPR